MINHVNRCLSRESRRREIDWKALSNHQARLFYNCRKYFSENLKFDSRVDERTCRWTYRAHAYATVIVADMIVTVHIYGTYIPIEESSSSSSKWTGHTTLTVHRYHDGVINISYPSDDDVTFSGHSCWLVRIIGWLHLSCIPRARDAYDGLFSCGGYAAAFSYDAAHKTKCVGS